MSKDGNPYWTSTPPYPTPESIPEFRPWKNSTGDGLRWSQKALNNIIGMNESEMENCVCKSVNPAEENYGLPRCCWAGPLYANSIRGGDDSLEGILEQNIAQITSVRNLPCKDQLGNEFVDSSVGSFLLRDPLADTAMNYYGPEYTRGCNDRYRPIRWGEFNATYQPPCAATNCSTLAPFCGETNEVGQFLRSVCPETCGCATPLSNLLLTDPLQGAHDLNMGMRYGLWFHDMKMRCMHLISHSCLLCDRMPCGMRDASRLPEILGPNSLRGCSCGQSVAHFLPDHME